MTYKISDYCLYQGKYRVICNINGSGLFDPAEHGIETDSDPGCYNGFRCEYRIDDGALFLAKVNLWLSHYDRHSIEFRKTLNPNRKVPMLFGKVPYFYTLDGINRKGEAVRSVANDVIVDGLHEPVPFTGGILLGVDHASKLLYDSPAFVFREVHELVFESGRLIEAQDRSPQMAEYREMLESHERKEGVKRSRLEITNWLEQNFRLNYDQKKDFTIGFFQPDDFIFEI